MQVAERPFISAQYRTHKCNDLNESHIGQVVMLSGWAHSLRDHGGVMFVDLRDRSGLIQTVAATPETAEAAKALGMEYVLRVKGKVQARPKGTENPHLATGKVEVQLSSIEVLNASKALPFMISAASSEISEEVRLQYRYLDLRRSKMKDIFRLRHLFCQNLRKFLTEEGFWEIETPMLTKSTPEGARDFLVPSRLEPGSFYALPQSPQIFKQLLMVGGIERYFQVARCFRDEDLRSDRQPEHTQLDMEMSFATQEDIWNVVERLIFYAVKETFGVTLKTPFERWTYQKAMETYQSDKPDLRFRSFTRREISKLFTSTQFKVFANALAAKKSIQALVIPQAAKGATRSMLDESVNLAKGLGAGGLVWMKVNEGALESPVEKFLSADERAGLLAMVKPGDLLFICAEEHNLNDRICKDLQKHWAKLTDAKPESEYIFSWVSDFPLLEQVATGDSPGREEKTWTYTHNPFTAPHPEDVHLLDSAPEKARSQQYDLVLNGVELMSGSIRNHRPDIQAKLFKLMGYTAEDIERKFGWMLKAYDYGAPPHGGFGMGIDRFIAIFTGEDSIRETIAFPKTQKGTCLLSEAPTPVDAKALRELGIKVAEAKK